MQDYRTTIKKIFDHVVDGAFALILVFIVIAIALGALQLFVTVWELFKFQGITGKYIDLITDVLTLYVLIELSRSLIEYFNSHRLKLAPIVDAGIVFILREILILLFKHEIKPESLYAFAAFLLVLGIIRTSAVLTYDREKNMDASH